MKGVMRMSNERRAYTNFGNWADSEQKLEETPEATPDVHPTGNTASCYLCARSFQGLPPEYAIRRDYIYDLTEDRKKPSTRVRYFMTFCVWCAHQYNL